MDPDRSQDVEMNDVNPWTVALDNHVILENILRYLSTGNLRTLQLVNKLWNRVSSTVLKKERRLKVRLNYNTSPEFIRSCAASRANLATIYEWDFGDIVPWRFQDLEDLKANIEVLNSIIAEDATGKLASGATFKIVHRTLDNDIRAYFSFLETISCRMRNLVILNLDLTEYLQDILEMKQGRYFQNVQLPHLEQVGFFVPSSRMRSKYKPLCKLIMNAAPNLKVIKGASLSCLWDAILQCGKAACLKSYTVEQPDPPMSLAQMETMLRDMDSLMEHTPALELLKLDHQLFFYNIGQSGQRNEEEQWSAIRRLLIHYRKSLRCIWTVHLAFIGLENNHMEVPVFESLEFLSFTTAREIHQLLPTVPFVKNQFPSLTHVKLELEGLTGDCLSRYFPQSSGEDAQRCSLPTVRKLELSNHYDKRGIEILCRVFPNVKEISFYQIIGEFTHSMQNGLWNLPPSVEWLTLHFMAMNYKKKLENLDELFTGIRKSTLEKLPHDAAQDAYLKIASRNGIRKLKALKRLRIIFDMNESILQSSLATYYGGTKVKLTPDYLKENMEFPFFLKRGTFTALSSLYAFSSPDFETYIYYDRRVHCAAEIEKLIQELQPNVIAAPCYMSKLKPELKEDLVRMIRSATSTEEPAQWDANESSDNETDDSLDSDYY